MNISSKVKVYLPLLDLLLVGLLIGCGNPALVKTLQPAKPPAQVEIPASPPTAIPKPPAELPASRVEVAYFHMPQRCATCLCFEEQAEYVVKTYFQNELASGKLTFQICAIGEKQNVAVVNKYNALGSQIFINTVINNTDHIKDIQDIWDWRCTGDKKGFDEKLRKVIEQSLGEVT